MAKTTEQKRAYKEALEANLKLMKLVTDNLNKEVKRLREYRLEHGDLYARYKDTGEVKFDGDQQPVTLRLPIGLSKAQAELLKVCEGLCEAGAGEAGETPAAGEGAGGEESSSSGGDGSILDKYRTKFGGKT